MDQRRRTSHSQNRVRLILDHHDAIAHADLRGLFHVSVAIEAWYDRTPLNDRFVLFMIVLLVGF